MDTPIIPSPLNQEDKSLGDSYLKFQLTSQTPAILAMEYIQEVLVVPAARITLMPNVPECVLGLLNRRNRVLWVIDLAQMLKLQPPEINPQQYNVVIIRVGQLPLGLIVYEISGVARFKTEDIQSDKGLFTSFLNTYLDGCIMQNKEILLVLNAKAIIYSPLLHNS